MVKKNRKTSVVIEESVESQDRHHDERYDSALRWFASVRGILSRLGDDALKLQNTAADDETLDEFLDADKISELYDALIKAFDRANEASPAPRCPVYIPSPLPK